MIRVIHSIRDTATGLQVHHCPKIGLRVKFSGCEACELKEKIEILQATYRIHCRFESSDVKGMIPSHAEDGGSGVFKKSKWNILEPKLDGAHCVIVVDEFGALHAFTRNVDRFGKQKEITANLPHLASLYLPDFADSILDSEIIVMVCGDAVGTLGATMSVVGASPDTAIATQEQFGYAHFFVFDIMRQKGFDATVESWRTRHVRKAVTVEAIRADSDLAHHYIHLMPSVTTNEEVERERLFKMFLKNGADIDGMIVPTEGVVLKNPDLRYFDTNAILKAKETISLDALITGWEAGKKGGKWEHSIGALLFSVFTPEHKLVEVGKVIPGDDAKRAEMFALLNGKTADEIAKLGLVIEIEGQNWSKERRIRHPRILRYRPDVSVPNTIDLSKVERK